MGPTADHATMRRMRRRPLPPPLDTERLARVRARVLVTVTAGSLAAVGCERAPEHTINRPATVHTPPTAPSTPPEGEPPVAVPPVQTAPATPPGPTNAPMRVTVDAGVAPRVIEPPERRPLPIPTANPPPPVMPRMPPGNG